MASERAADVVTKQAPLKHRKVTLKPSASGGGFVCPVCGVPCWRSHIVDHLQTVHTGWYARGEITNLVVTITVEFDEVPK